MRILVPIIVSLLGFHALAQTDSAPKRSSTALGALKLVPEEQVGNLVSIFAREGVPSPDRWYFVTYDPKEESGVREFVVSGSRFIASRVLSQFAETLKPTDVLTGLGKGGLQIDSDHASQIALDYGRANSLTINSINYELKQERTGTDPLWKLVCLNQSGDRVGELKISAVNGAVISHEGFAVEPTPVPVKVAQAVTATDAQAAARPSATPKPTPKKDDNQPKGLGAKMKRYFFNH